MGKRNQRQSKAEANKRKAIELAHAHKTREEIARQLGVAKSTVDGYLKGVAGVPQRSEGGSGFAATDAAIANAVAEAAPLMLRRPEVAHDEPPFTAEDVAEMGLAVGEGRLIVLPERPEQRERIAERVSELAWENLHDDDMPALDEEHAVRQALVQLWETANPAYQADDEWAYDREWFLDESYVNDSELDLQYAGSDWDDIYWRAVNHTEMKDAIGDGDW